jgi:hypothetical protein
MLMPAPEQKPIYEPTLNFSHKTYEKFKDIDTKNPIKILEVFNKTTAYMSDSFKEYDTTYKDASGRRRQFNLHNGMNIILLLQDSKGKVFTTVRSYTVKKFSYYMYMRGKTLNIKFLEPNKYEKDDKDDGMRFPAPINNIYF